MATRQILFAIAPGGREAASDETFVYSLSYPWVTDGNLNSKAFTCGYVPPNKLAGVSMMQDTAFLGTNAATGYTVQIFREDYKKDGSTAITARLITQRLQPEARPDANIIRSSGTMRAHRLNFNGKGPLERGGSISFSKDVDPIEDPSVTWTSMNSVESTDTSYQFVDGLCNWLHLMVTITADLDADINVFPAFDLLYYPMGVRQGRDS